MKYIVEFYRMVSVVKTIEAQDQEDLERKVNKELKKGDIMKKVPTKISKTEWEVLDNVK